MIALPVFHLRPGDQSVKHSIILALNQAEAVTVEIKPYVKARSIEQNKLQRKWLAEAAAQGDQTAEEYRGYCKLHFGVPILRNEDEEFKDAYDRVIRPRSYEDKLELMMVPIDVPVTSRMNVKQKTQYLDSMYRFFASLGFILTEPEWNL